MIDAMKSYLQMASGILEASTAKAVEAAQGMVSQGLQSGTKAPEQMASQIGLIAEDMMAQSRTNRELVVGLVRTEVERAIGRIGFVREEELAAVRAHVDRLEGQLRGAVDSLGDLPGVQAVTGLAGAAAEEASVVADSAVAEARAARTLADTTATRKLGLEHTDKSSHDVPPARVVVRRPAAKKTAAKKAPAKKTAAKKAPAKKTAAKKSTAKKSTAKKAPARKSAAKKATSAGSGS